jgi:hypothetical protein
MPDSIRPFFSNRQWNASAISKSMSCKRGVRFEIRGCEMVTIQYLDRSVSCELSLLIGIVYLLGMLTRWTIVGLLRRSIHRVSQQRAK